jgi:hypothetical protein
MNHKGGKKHMANRIIVYGVEAELVAGNWQSEDEELKARLEVAAPATLRSPAFPDSDGRQLDAAVRLLGARILERTALAEGVDEYRVYEGDRFSYLKQLRGQHPLPRKALRYVVYRWRLRDLQKKRDRLLSKLHNQASREPASMRQAHIAVS